MAHYRPLNVSGQGHPFSNIPAIRPADFPKVRNDVFKPQGLEGSGQWRPCFAVPSHFPVVVIQQTVPMRRNPLPLLGPVSRRGEVSWRQSLYLRGNAARRHANASLAAGIGLAESQPVGLCFAPGSWAENTAARENARENALTLFKAHSTLPVSF